jgi:glycosyltransferase involved in cell wall biosynthesis
VASAGIAYEKFDIVWCGQWPYFHLFSLLLHRAPWRTRMVVDWWEVWGAHWFAYRRLLGLAGWLAEALLANLTGRLGGIVTISMLGFRQLRALGTPRRHLHYIPNGIDLAAFAQVPPADGERDLIYFGRLKDHKNVDHLIRAVAFLKSRGQDLTCDIIGDGPEREKLVSLAKQLNLAGQITFHGAVDDQRLVSLLKRAQIFVHPSTKEGGGSITLLEANACGLPVVCYNHPNGIDPGQIRLNETGLLATPVNHKGLGEAIARMLMLCRSKPIQEACVAHARDFGWDAIAMQYGELFEQVLSGTISRPLQKA